MTTHTTIRFKMLCVVVLLTTLLGLAVFFVGKDTYQHYTALQIAQCRELVAEETTKIENIIQDLQGNVRELSLMGELLFQTAPEQLSRYGPYTVLRNFQLNTVAVGGGIWYRPYLLGNKRELACFYAYSRNDTPFFDESFASPSYHYPTQRWYTAITRELDSRSSESRYNVVWTHPYVDAAGTRALMTTVGSGMYSPNGEFLGLTTIDWLLDDIARQVANIRPTANSITLFADVAHDVILTLHDPSQSQRFTGFSLRTVPWFDNKAPEERTFIHEGVSYLSFSKKLGNGMGVIVNVPEEELFYDIKQTLRLALLALAGTLLLAADLTWVLLERFINNPVRQLSRAAAKVGAGNLDIEFPVCSRDELGALAEAFTNMTRSLKGHLAHLAAITAEKERIAAELYIARDIQASMLPSIFPPFPQHTECDLRAFMLPAKEVGGDFYDFFFVDEYRLVVVIADVSDKGVPAALLMVIAKTLIRNNASGSTGPGEILAKTNAQLCENNDAGMFVTAFIGILDVRDGTFQYANAGHNPFHIAAPGERFVRIAPKPCLPLAVMEDTNFQEETRQITPDSVLFLHTDGVTEASNPENALFGEGALRATLDGLLGVLPRDLHQCITGVKKALDDFAHGAQQNDDITMLALAYFGPADAQERTEPRPSVSAAAPATATPTPPLPLPVSAPATTPSPAPILCERRFPARVDALPDFMALVENMLSQGTFTDSQQMRFCVAAEECFVNIAQYAYADSPAAGDIRVCLELSPVPVGRLALRMVDTGTPFNPLQRTAPDITLPAEEREPGGLGIFLACQGTDAIAYERSDDSNILTMLLQA